MGRLMGGGSRTGAVSTATWGAGTRCFGGRFSARTWPCSRNWLNRDWAGCGQKVLPLQIQVWPSGVGRNRCMLIHQDLANMVLKLFECPPGEYTAEQLNIFVERLPSGEVWKGANGVEDEKIPVLGEG